MKLTIKEPQINAGEIHSSDLRRSAFICGSQCISFVSIREDSWINYYITIPPSTQITCPVT